MTSKTATNRIMFIPIFNWFVGFTKYFCESRSLNSCLLENNKKEKTRENYHYLQFKINFRLQQKASFKGMKGGMFVVCDRSECFECWIKHGGSPVPQEQATFLLGHFTTRSWTAEFMRLPQISTEVFAWCRDVVHTFNQ